MDEGRRMDLEIVVQELGRPAVFRAVSFEESYGTSSCVKSGDTNVIMGTIRPICSRSYEIFLCSGGLPDDGACEARGNEFIQNPGSISTLTCTQTQHTDPEPEVPILAS